MIFVTANKSLFLVLIYRIIMTTRDDQMWSSSGQPYYNNVKII